MFWTEFGVCEGYKGAVIGGGGVKDIKSITFKNWSREGGRRGGKKIFRPMVGSHLQFIKLISLVFVWGIKV